MEDSINSSSSLSSPIPGVSETEQSVLPEALQPPTRPVSTGFSIWLAIASTVPVICYVGVGAFLLPAQVEQIDKVNKVAILGLGAGLAALLALIFTPIAGALSDRTISRFGRRRPWIFLGAMMNVLSLAIMMRAGTVVALFAGWCLFVVSYNLILTILNTLIADQVPEKQRGTVSGIAGLSTPVGIIIGGILIVLIAPTISYINIIIGRTLIVLMPPAISYISIIMG